MNDLPRQKLIEIVGRHGKSVVDDVRRAEGLFRDYFGSFKREIAVLTMALEEGVARDLAATPANTPRKVLLTRLTRRLVDNLALTEDAATWAVNSWGLALGVISSEDLKILEPQNLEKEQTVIFPATIENAPPPQKESIPNAVIIVSQNNDGDFVSINEAIKAAKNAAKILVRPGLYEESIILDKQIEITGDGDMKNIVVKSLNSSCVSMQTDRAVIGNLTLQCAAGQSGNEVFAVDIASGEMTLQNCDVTSDSLSCIAVHGANTRPLIRDCTVRDGANSGIYFFDSATGIIEDCRIFRNQEANVVIAENSNPVIRNCRIFSGADAGIFVYEKGLGTIDDCDIYGHGAAEIVVSSGGSPVLRGCNIHNSNRTGVLVKNNGSALIENCNVYENADAGISIDGASIAAISNCTINANGAVAVRVKGESNVRVENSDLTGNRLATWDVEEGVFIENTNNQEF